jgi:hypothetical protein
MPIRFRCPHCQQRLSIGTQKSGAQTQCPTCKELVSVPTDPETIAAHDLAAPAVSIDTPPQAKELMSQSPPAARENRPSPSEVLPDRPASLAPAPASTDSLWISKLDATRVTVPRYVIFAQGLLLAAVGVVCLIIGVFMGLAWSPTTRPIDPATLPCVVRGRVEYEDSQGNRLPDIGAVILALPTARQPEKSIASDGLGVEDPEPKADHPGLRELESLGGKIARVDPAGRFEFRVPRGGEFHIIAISRQAQRGKEPHQPKITSVLGKYIGPATKLLGEHSYQMQEPVLREERHLDFLFAKLPP